MANSSIGDKIPTTYLPEDWAARGAKIHGCSTSQIERIVYGLAPATKKNLGIFDDMLKMAAEGKAAFDQEQKERAQKLNALAD